MQDLYFDWLLSKVDGWPYRQVCDYLYHIEFRWDYTIELDGDRAEKGKALRYLYFTEKRQDSGMSGMPCTVLEMLVALAIDMENIMGEPGNDHPERWFSDMLCNLGIANSFSRQDIVNKVGRWMARDYMPDGNGGLFPLSNSPNDQRRSPIWAQAGLYMCERV